MNVQQALRSNVKVAVRVRPFNKRERDQKSTCCIQMEPPHTTIITHPETQHKKTFTYDYSFWSFDPQDTERFVSQRRVFETVGQHVLRQAAEGYNCSVMAYGQTGCLSPDTLILMANGQTKPVKNIRLHDQVMDSRGRGYRVVTGLYHGHQNMFRIRDQTDPKRGYSVNESHILTLWNKQKKQIVDIPISTYITLPVHETNHYLGIRLHAIHETHPLWQEKPVPWDPYWLALCLSASVQQNRIVFNTVQTKVLSHIQSFCRQYHFQCQQSSKPFHYYVCGPEIDSLLILLSARHIPFPYMQNSRSVRWKMVNGFLDMLGEYEAKTQTYHIQIPSSQSFPSSSSSLSSPPPSLITSIEVLVRSLGIVARRITRYELVLYGLESPLLPQPQPRSPGDMNWIPKTVDNGDVDGGDDYEFEVYPIEIEPLGEGEYYGFQLDGGDHRFVLGDFTITHNSGKTYTQMGGGTPQKEDEGLIPRICQNIFQNTSFNRIEITYLEIYAEKVRDLLHPQSTDQLTVREHPVWGPYVPGLVKIPVQNYKELKTWLDQGNQHRITASTQMNNRSSRSHAIFTLHVYPPPESNLGENKSGEDKEKENQEKVWTPWSKIQLVDLAGSERVKDSQVQGVHLKEAIHINKSLTILGRVISALAKPPSKKKEKKEFIPFRDSVLTWLLKDSLGGNSQTFMIATISPADIHYDETLNTLQYASRTKKIINRVTVAGGGKRMKLSEMIQHLRTDLQSIENRISQLFGHGHIGSLQTPADMEQYRYLMIEHQQILNALSGSWEERLRQTQQQYQDLFQTCSNSVVSQNPNPNSNSNLTPPPRKWINISPNITLDQELVYELKVGEKWSDLEFPGEIVRVEEDIVLVRVQQDSPPVWIHYHNNHDNNDNQTFKKLEVESQCGIFPGDILSWGSYKFKLL